MANLMRTYCPTWFMDYVPDPFDRDDYDYKARGIRRKPDRYRAIVRKWLSMTSRAIKWNLSDIIPEELLPPQIIETFLQVYGWASIIRKDGKYHLVSGNCAGFLGEYDEYYMPTGVIVSNPYAKQKIDGIYHFGVDAVLIRNDTYMQGLLPIMEPRGEMEVELEISILQGLENLRIVNIIHAATDKMKEAALSFFRQIKKGRAGIVTGSDSKSRWSGAPTSPVIENLPTGGVPANYLVQFIEAAAYNKSALYTDIGLQFNGNMKREALSPAETEMNRDALRPLIDDMLDCRIDAVRQLRTVFGIDIPEPELAGAWKLRAQSDNLEAETAADEEPSESDPEPEGGADDDAETD